MSATMPIGVRMVGGTAFLASACVVGYIAGSALRKNYKRAAKGVATRGVITGFQGFGGNATSRTYCPKIEFETRNGEKISFVSSYGSSSYLPPEEKIGRKVKVVYNSENPQDAVEASFFKLWIFPLFFLIVAIFFLFASLAFYTAMFGDAA